MKIDFKSFKKKCTKDKTVKFPTGSRVYAAHQGGGKTLSMVHDALILKEKWPEMVIYSNIKIDSNVLKYNYFETPDGLNQAINKTNGDKGVLILIDEAHLFFFRKQGISFDTLMSISQQRKDRRAIFFSTQIWEEMDISLRKQVNEIVKCRHFGNIQINTIYDGHQLSYDKKESQYVAPKLYSSIFKHNDELYHLYNTYQKIITNKDYYRPLAPDNNFIKSQVEISVKKR